MIWLDLTPQERAELYVSALRPGSEILEDTDGEVIEPFRRWITSALNRRGWHLEPVIGGWRVIAGPRRAN